MSTRGARGTGDDDDPFAVLGISRDCTLSELKQVYRLLARRYHPDVNASPEAAAQMCRINLAFGRALEQIKMPLHATVEAVRQSAAVPSAPARPTPASAPARPSPSPPTSPPRPARSRRWTGAQQISARIAVRATGLTHGIRQRTASRSVRVRTRTVWAAVASIGTAALVAFGAVHILSAHSGTPDTQSAMSPGLRLGATTTISWPDTGPIAISERLLARLGPGQHLNEAPQWSPDGAYVALSVTPDGGTGGGTGATAASIVVLEHGRQVTTLSGTSSRWSPIADQLAVLTGPRSTGPHQLEIVSPAASEGHATTVLDPDAGTHLAWSDDGLQIAYSANAQQQIRLVGVAQRSPQALVNAPPGQHLIPVGWQSGRVVSILHTGASYALVAVDLAQHRVSSLGTLEPLPSGPAVVATRGGTLFVAETRDAGLTALAWAGEQQWQAQLVGIQTVKFLSGWSFDGNWLALAPAPTGAGASHICLAHLPTADAAPPTPWVVHCLPVAGTLLGVSWEPHSDSLSYVRTSRPGDALELRELRVQPARAGPVSATVARGGGSPGPQPAPLGMLGVMLAGLRRKMRLGRGVGAPCTSCLESGPKARSVAVAGTYGRGAPADARLRIAIISEILRWPPDEGLKRIALALVQCLSRHAAVLAIGTRAQRAGSHRYPVVTIPTNRSFIEPRLWIQLRRFHPRIVCYIPGSGLTTYSLLRALALRLGMILLGRRSALALISVQPRSHGRLHACLFWLLRPTIVLVQSELRTRELRALGCRARAFTGAVDVEVFRPLSAGERLRLRQHWNIAPESFVVLHVGHLKASRNLGMLAALQRIVPDIVVVVVASTSTRQDADVEQLLKQGGVRVIKTYVQHIESLYQLADCYVFPVQETCGSAELPLSVLEALACGLPVATTRFGALPELLPPSTAVRYFTRLDELTACVRDYQAGSPNRWIARALALPYGWDRAALDLLEHLVTVLDAGTGPPVDVRTHSPSYTRGQSSAQ